MSKKYLKMSKKIPLKSDKFKDPKKAALNLQDAQMDRIAIRDAVESFALEVEGKFKFNNEDLGETLDKIRENIIDVEETLAEAADKIAVSGLEDEIGLLNESLGSVKLNIKRQKVALRGLEASLKKRLSKTMTANIIPINNRLTKIEAAQGKMPATFWGRIKLILFGN